MAPKARLANIRSPHVQAIMQEALRFAKKADAEAHLHFLEDEYVTSKFSQPEEDTPRTILWIRGFEVTEAEKAAHYRGNYALITIKPAEDGLFTLTATKLESDLKHHPQRERPKAPHPNWGHPVLRRVKNGHIFRTIEEARAAIQQLQMEYPKTAIPLTNKMYLMIYSKQQSPRVQKFVLEIVPLKQGGYQITSAPNDYTPKPSAEDAPTPETMDDQPVGYFTSKVAMGKKPDQPSEQ